MFSYKSKRWGSCVIVFAALVVCFACSGSVFADWQNPAQAADGDSVWAVWAQPQKTISNIVCAEKKQGKWQAVETLSSTPYVNIAPSIALDDEMQPWVVWSSQMNDSSDLLFCKRNADGTWSKTGLVEPFDALSDSTPAIANIGDGRMGLVWAGFDGTSDEIYFSVSTGSGWSKAVKISGNNNHPDVDPVIAPCKEGVMVVWSAFDGIAYRLVYTVFDSEKSQWSKPEAVSRAMMTEQTLPFFELSKTGLKVFWTDSGEYFNAQWKDGKWTAPQGADIKDEYFSILSGLDTTAVTRAWLAAPGCEMSSRYNIARFYSNGSSRFILASLGGAQTQFFATSDAFDITQALGMFSSAAYAQESSVDTNKIICFGDSITEGWAGQDYPSRLSAATGKVTVNAGRGGERTSGGVSRIGSVLSGNMAGFICILEGTNDIGDGRSPESIAANLSTMIDRARNVGTTPYMSTIMPRNDIFNSSVERANVVLKATFSGKGARYVDMYSAFAGKDLSTVYEDNRLHPNAAGFDIMSSVWAGLFGGGSGGGGGGCGVSYVGKDKNGRDLNFFWLFALAAVLFGISRIRGARQ